jgi:hypothetical protein
LTTERIGIPDSDLLSRQVAPAALNRKSVGALLELGLGISAWKSNGVDRWTVRGNPSSGNLHPLEANVVMPATDLGPAGLYHSEALGLGLELPCAFELASLSNTSSSRSTSFWLRTRSIILTLPRGP